MAEPADADLLFRPALELAALVRAGELSARELIEASLRRVDALDPELNAFVDVFHEEALAGAQAIRPGDERPFAGVPVAIKNNRALAGHRVTHGAGFMGDWIAPYDHNVVARLRAAGCIVVGTTTLSEWGILPWTHTERFGATRNPWDHARTSGGSSGGAAAAVAAGLVPMAHGNDGGGSIRIPAACCGLLGLKAQRHRISLHPEVGESFLGVDGVLARTTADSAAALDVLAGREVGDASWAPPPAEPFAVTGARDPGRLRIAVTTFPPYEVDVAPACAHAAREARNAARVAGPRGRGGRRPSVARAVAAGRVHQPVRPARDDAGRLRPPRPRSRAGTGRPRARELGAVAARGAHVVARRPPGRRAPAGLRARRAGLDGRLRRRPHADAGRGAGGPARRAPARPATRMGCSGERRSSRRSRPPRT